LNNFQKGIYFLIFGAISFLVSSAFFAESNDKKYMVYAVFSLTVLAVGIFLAAKNRKKKTKGGKEKTSPLGLIIAIRIIATAAACISLLTAMTIRFHSDFKAFSIFYFMLFCSISVLSFIYRKERTV
jgi:uncharacterized membrane protein YfcA